MYKLFTLTVLNFAIAILHQHAVAALNYGTCESQFNSSGLCLQVADCQFIFDMFVADTISPENEVLLKNSYCGMDNTFADLSRRILVCCPTKFCHESAPTNHSAHQPGDVLPDAGTCGRALSPYIYGGEEADIDEYPWMALIQYKTPSNQFGFLCGGTLINSRYVLTAAHCLHTTNDTVWTLHSVRLGEWDLSMDPDCVTDNQGNRHCAPPVVEVAIESATPHPDYQRESRDQLNDIGLLRLKESVTFSKFVRPICLMAATDLCSYLLPVGTATEVAGWGATEKHRQNSAVKLKITVNITDTNKCHSTYRRRLVSIDSRHHLCAGGEEGIDACRGDSGGPLMLNQRINHRDVYFAVGVISLGPTPCGSIGWPGVYSRVCNYIEWIKQTLRP